MKVNGLLIVVGLWISLASTAFADCPPCAVPQGYEDGIHNSTQLNIVVTGWEGGITYEPNEICCCCFTTNWFERYEPSDAIPNRDCDGPNPNCRFRVNSLIWDTETVALPNGINSRDEEDMLEWYTKDDLVAWTREEVSCFGGAWFPCPDTTVYEDGPEIFVPECDDCP